MAKGLILVDSYYKFGKFKSRKNLNSLLISLIKNFFLKYFDIMLMKKNKKNQKNMKNIILRLKLIKILN